MGLFLKSVYLSAALSLAYIFLLYRSQPYRRLSSAATVIAFAAGMLAVVVVSAVRRLVPVGPIESSAGALFGAAAIEEAAKLGLAGVTILRFGFPSVAEPLDVAVLMGVLGVGFGVYEDFWYIFSSSYPSWIAGDAGRFGEIFRVVTLARAFPGHILFNGISGFLLGRAVFTRDGRRVLWIVGSLGVATLLHAGFNGVALLRGPLLLLTYVVLLLGVFLALRRHALRGSPFGAVIRLLEGQDSSPYPWPFQRPAVDYLLAEGFAWPGRLKEGFFQFYPVVLSLCILFPLLLILIYFVNRLVTLGA